jgi:SWIM zinc finger
VLLNGCVTTATGPAFTEADLRTAAGRRSFDRGLHYLDAVAGLEVIGNQIIATVRGTEDYLVVLTVGASRPRSAKLKGECDCPFAQEGFFCKHCVAVGLAVARGGAEVARGGAEAARGDTAAPGAAAGLAADGISAGAGVPAQRVGDRARPSDLESWLSSLSRDDLLALVIDQVLEDDDWRRRLELRAAGAAADVAEISKRAAILLDAGGELGQYGYLEGPESWRYSRRVSDVAEIVDNLTRSGDASGAIAIAEQALALIAESSRNASDRAGIIGSSAADLVASHYAACQSEPPDPRRLASFLAGHLMSGDDVPAIEFGDYASLLGPVGLAALRDQVTAAWTADPSGWAQRRAMEQVLRAAGDVDALVAMLSAGLDDHGFGHLRIIEELEQAGRAEEALSWAERGLREASKPDLRLADYVVEQYRARGKIAAAVAVRREWFTTTRSLTAYQQLREICVEAGTWQATRQWALGLLRADAATVAGTGRSSQWAPPAVLIDALIADGDVAGAWASAQGVASDRQWLRLADLVAETRPADALAVYLRLIDGLRKQTGDGVYERIAQLLISARACHRRLGTASAFDSYLRGLRADQKRKRKLIRILDAHQL